MSEKEAGQKMPGPRCELVSVEGRRKPVEVAITELVFTGKPVIVAIQDFVTQVARHVARIGNSMDLERAPDQINIVSRRERRVLPVALVRLEVEPKCEAQALLIGFYADLGTVIVQIRDSRDHQEIDRTSAVRPCVVNIDEGQRERATLVEVVAIFREWDARDPHWAARASVNRPLTSLENLVHRDGYLIALLDARIEALLLRELAAGGRAVADQEQIRFLWQRQTVPDL